MAGRGQRASGRPLRPAAKSKSPSASQGSAQHSPHHRLLFVASPSPGKGRYAQRGLMGQEPIC